MTNKTANALETYLHAAEEALKAIDRMYFEMGDGLCDKRGAECLRQVARRSVGVAWNERVDHLSRLDKNGVDHAYVRFADRLNVLNFR